MARLWRDRVLETSTTTGTGALTLAGTVTGYRAFSSVCSTNDTINYVIQHQTADEWEVGLGTYSGANTLTRTTVLASSNAGSAVNFSAGTKYVYANIPAAVVSALFTGTSAAVQKGDGTGGLTPAAATDLGAGLHTIYIPAAAMTSRTTNGPSSGSVETTTNKNMIVSLDFDTTTQEFAQFSFRAPKSWNESTVTASFIWSHAATTTNFGVVWALEGVALSDTDAGDAAFGTAQQIADTGGTTNTRYITSATSAITIAGTPAAEDWLLFQVKRVPADASDNMSVDARLEGITIYFTTDALTDV